MSDDRNTIHKTVSDYKQVVAVQER